MMVIIIIIIIIMILCLLSLVCNITHMYYISLFLLCYYVKSYTLTHIANHLLYILIHNTIPRSRRDLDRVMRLVDLRAVQYVLDNI